MKKPLDFIGEVKSVRDDLSNGRITIQVPDRQNVNRFLVQDLVVPVDRHWGCTIYAHGAPLFLAYRVVSRDRLLNTVTLEMLDIAEEVILTATYSNLLPGTPFIVHMSGNKVWPPDDFYGYPYGDDKNAEWASPSRKCAKDSHKHADTGMRVSYCKSCNTKMRFINWEWVEVDDT